MQDMKETQIWSLSLEDSPGEGNGSPLQYSCLENPMDGGAWYGLQPMGSQSQTWLVTEHTQESLCIILQVLKM